MCFVCVVVVVCGGQMVVRAALVVVVVVVVVCGGQMVVRAALVVVVVVVAAAAASRQGRWRRPTAGVGGGGQ
jgi:hypothetical protein